MAIQNPLAPNPTQLMSTLRMMPDSQLFQYAQMHQNDPYIFPLAFQESNARKAARAAAQMQKQAEQLLAEAKRLTEEATSLTPAKNAKTTRAKKAASTKKQTA